MADKRIDDRTDEEKEGLYDPFVAHEEEIDKDSIKIPPTNKRAIRKMFRDIKKDRANDDHK